MKFRLFGIDFYISFLFTAMLSLMLLLDKTGLLSSVFITSLIHELAHIAAQRIFGEKPRSIRFNLCAVEIIRPNLPTSRLHSVLISLFGPLSNILIGTALMLAYNMIPTAQTANSAAIQLTVGIFNLLPIKGLDGGSIAEALIPSRKLTAVLSFATVITVVTASFLLLKGRGTGLAISVVYVFAAGLMCERRL